MDPKGAKESTNRRSKPRWSLVAPGTPNQAPMWKFTGPKRNRGPKKKLNTDKIRQARKILQNRWSTSGPQRMMARETLEKLNIEPPETSSDDSTDSDLENVSSWAEKRTTPSRDPEKEKGSREGQRWVAWEPPSQEFRGLEVTHWRLDGDRTLTYSEGQGWMEHTTRPAEGNYRPASPPGGGFYRWTSITSPAHWHDDHDHVATLREAALATAAICVTKKKDLDQ